MDPATNDRAAEQEQRSYYNAIADTYDSHFASPQALAYRNRLYSRIFAGIDLSGARVLDVACGGGENSVFFRERGCDVVGVDISDAQCRIFRRRFPGSLVVTGSMAELAFAEETFDVVVTESLHHSHPHLERTLAEISRVLRPGGHFLLWEPEVGSIFDRARKLWYRLDPSYFQDNEQSIDIEQVVSTLQDRFTVERTEYGGNVAHLFVLNSMHFRIPPRLVGLYARGAMALEFLLNRLATRLLSMWVLCLLRKKDAAR
ncbi:protein of unknown function [Magnetospirillum sp. XM-1]|uniref:class I SAM-dependent methyltransferase n=1 Tax=Magnetospirillum sp. XM-1 TaxID=1663591 RepID=UPI00073DC8F2|nr:class I SAM-dependent methyltransferase [Magnetospirillum sp. XM-1]CUW38073.1 protein of unknown function [Magnetospirillum sp. XM-1]